MTALPEILSRWAQRFRTKPPMPAFDGDPASTEARVKGSATLTEPEVEAAVLVDYAAVLGKVIFLAEVECYDDDGLSRTAYCVPPAVARVLPWGSNDSVLRWMDDVACDPTYNIEVMEPHPALSGLTPCWMYGTSRSTDGTVLPGPYAVASDGHQRWYAGKTAASEEDHAMAAESAAEAAPATISP